MTKWIDCLSKETRLKLENIQLNWSNHSFGYADELQADVSYLLRRYSLKSATIRDLLDKVRAELGA